MKKTALMLSSLVSAEMLIDTCNFLQNNSVGFCESRPDSRNCVKWKIATLYRCKTKAKCTEAFEKSNNECLEKSEQAVRDNWAGKEINSQAVGLCFGWQLDVHTTCASKANRMQTQMMEGVQEIGEASISKFLEGKQLVARHEARKNKEY